MKGRTRLLAAVAMMALSPVQAAAQQAPAPAAPAAATPAAPYVVPDAMSYHEVTAWPDWNGVWYPDWTLLFEGRSRAAPKWNPATQAKVDAYLESIRENGPNQEQQAQCLPPGLPGTMQQPYPIEFVYSPGRVTILTEAYQQARRVYVDGRALPEDPDLFFLGNSVGRWEGDTLIVDTNGLSPQTLLAPGVNHTEKSTLRERIYLQAPGQMILEMTFSNPDLLTEPFVTRIAYKLDNSFPIREYVCAENNRLTTDGHGANIDLGLDEEDAEGGADPFAGTE
ncbi:hypothetical protein [Tsuneonella sp. HG222]